MPGRWNGSGRGVRLLPVICQPSMFNRSIVNACKCSAVDQAADGSTAVASLDRRGSCWIRFQALRGETLQRITSARSTP